MDTLSFLQHVLPGQGQYVALTINDDVPRQFFFGSVGELATNCQRLDSLGNNTYYAISSFKPPMSRKQDNVLLTKMLALDVDCAPGKPYADQREGLQELLKFVTITGLPKPMVVSSGRGLHVYWILDTPLEPIAWKPLSNALKQACVTHSFNVDNGLTANSSLVLRPTETHNPRNNAEVKVLIHAPVTTADTIRNVLAPATATTAPCKATGLLANIAVNQDIPLAHADAVASKCLQIKWAIENQPDVPEPLWYDIIGVAAFCVGPETTAREWSDKHPDYDAAKTLRKLQQWKDATTGPATCAKIEFDRPNGCRGCKQRTRVTTPAMLGVQHREVAAANDAPDAIAQSVQLPKPFKRVAKGIMQTADGTDLDVCPFDIYPMGYGRDESLGYETVRYKWRRPHIGWQDLVLRQANLNDEAKEFATAIADQGIVLGNGEQIRRFRYMLRAYMDGLRTIRTMTNIHDSMGWKEDFTQFVIGSKLYKREADGKVVVEDVALTATSNRMGNGMYGHAGTVEEWRGGTRILQAMKMPYHVFAVNQGFAAPLWALTGLKGMTISLWGGSGCGKSIAQQWQQSIWGDPGKLHVSAKATHNALFNRLGVYRNLPMTIDEATKMEDVGEFCYWVTEGEDKKRLTQVAEERKTKEWATTVTVSTNTSFISKMTAAGHETDAQMARLLELRVPSHRLFSDSSQGGRKLHQHITTHFGVAGDLYVKALLALGKEGLLRRISETTDKFYDMYQYKFTGIERFIEQDLILQHVGGQIAEEAGLIAYDYKAGIRWALRQVDAQRVAAADNTTDAFKLVNEYLNEIAANTLVAMHTPNFPLSVDPSRIPRGEIKARFDVYRKSIPEDFDSGTVMLVVRPFKYWVTSRGYDYNAMKGEFLAAGIDATPSTKRCCLGRGTALRPGQQYVLGLKLNNDHMQGFLDSTQIAAEDLVFGQVAVVPSIVTARTSASDRE